MSLIVCDECKHEFLTASVKIHEAMVDCNGRQLSLVYFSCPKCSRIYRVCLKDDEYEKLRADLEQTKKRIRRNNGRNDLEFQRTLQTMVLRKAERLQKHVTRLNEEFSGTFTFSASENNEKEQQIIYLP